MLREATESHCPSPDRHLNRQTRPGGACAEQLQIATGNQVTVTQEGVNIHTLQFSNSPSRPGYAYAGFTVTLLVTAPSLEASRMPKKSNMDDGWPMPMMGYWADVKEL